MKVSELRGYGMAASDAEALWSPAVKRRMEQGAKKVILSHLGLWQRVRFLMAHLAAKRRARSLDLSAIRSRGMTNETFLAQQLDYLCVFAALSEVKGQEKALVVMNEVMDATAREPLLLLFPEPADVRRAGDPVNVFREYFRAVPRAARKAGCHDVVLSEDSENAVQFDITWCVWLELARAMGVPSACVANCHADDITFPEYFRSLGIRYRRTGTLALGAPRCDFRFERIPAATLVGRRAAGAATSGRCAERQGVAHSPRPSERAAARARSPRHRRRSAT